MENGAGLKILLALAKPLFTASLKKLKKLKPIEEFRLNQAIDSAIAEVWDSLDSYFESEGIGIGKRDIIAAAAEYELRPFAEDVDLLLAGSLDGEKLFEQIRAKDPFPQEIRDEGLEQVYRMVFPLMAAVLCKAPVIVEGINDRELPEVLRRFDQLKDQMTNVSAGIALVRHDPIRRADELYNRVLQQALKKVLLGVEVTGLYGDSPLKQAKEEMFVLPQITEQLPPQKDATSSQEARFAKITAEHLKLFLDPQSRSVVRGAPGSGKSTWSRWLQLHALREKGLLTLHVRLRSWQAVVLPKVIDLLESLVGPNMASEISPESVAKWIAGRNICVVLDGLDEVAPERRDAMLCQINDLADYLQGGPCLITSRPLHSHHLASLEATWSRWEIQPFDDPRVCDYIRRWYQHAPLKDGASREIDVNALHSLLSKDPHVSPLTSNPLMLATLLMVHHNDGELPKGRSRLYSRYIDGMLGIWDDRQEVFADNSGLDREQKKRVLTSLAVALHVNNVDEVGEEDAIQLFSEAMDSYGCHGDPKKVVDSLQERSGLIVGPGSYSFSHKSIGEYLVAQAICDGDREIGGQKFDRFLLSQERTNDRWLNVLYFWAGSSTVRELQSFIESLREEDLTLRAGLLWDQMPRFQKEWLGCQVRGLLEEMNRLPFDTLNVRGRYIGMSFHNSALTEEEDKIGSIAELWIRHVSQKSLDMDEFAQLFRQIDYEKSEANKILHTPIFNLVVGAISINLIDNPGRFSFIAGISRWPIWLRQSNCALRAADVMIQHDVTTGLEMWRTAFPEDRDTAEVWLGAALFLKIAHYNLEDSLYPVYSHKLLEILSLPWPLRSLQLSLNFINTFGPQNSQNKPENRYQPRNLLHEAHYFFASSSKKDRVPRALSDQLITLLDEIHQQHFSLETISSPED